ncbi:trimerization motif [Caudoviricetes sp.]|nr:trimerization motif [Caudoviricetes sp.]UOF81005.1 trimerization motif [Caudoviricetes sp.]UOF81401.1 trimerization motif [Caudoviricetes sp.]
MIKSKRYLIGIVFVVVVFVGMNLKIPAANAGPITWIIMDESSKKIEKAINTQTEEIKKKENTIAKLEKIIEELEKKLAAYDPAV